MNKVIIVGNNVQDIDVRKTQSGKSVCSFTIAINEYSKDGNKTEFINCQAWDKNADLLGQYVKKGQKLLVEGRLHVSTFEGKDGNKQKNTVVVTDRIEFLTAKSDENVSCTHNDIPNNDMYTQNVSKFGGVTKSYTNNVSTNSLAPDDLPFI